MHETERTAESAPKEAQARTEAESERPTDAEKEPVAGSPTLEGIRVGAFARFHEVESLAGAPEGRRFGYVLRGIPMPAEGSCYVVEDLGGRRVRPIAYVDRFGRAFACDEPQEMPPARSPELAFEEYEDRDDGSGCVKVADAGQPFRAGEYRARSPRCYDLTEGTVLIGSPTTSLSYAAAIATAYLSCVEIPRLAGQPIVPFGPERVFEALKRADVFTAVRRVVEATEQIEDNPFQRPAGLLSYLVRTLREGGLDRIDPLSLPRRMPEGELDPDAAASLDVRLARTRSYANMFYLGFDAEAVTPEGRQALSALESALNRFLLVGEALDAKGRALLASEEECCRLDLDLIERAAEQAPGTASYAPDLEAQGEKEADLESEWDVRRAFCEACERMRLPYRLSYRFRLNAPDRTMGIEATCPPEELMPRLTPADDGTLTTIDDEERARMQADYARSVAELVLAAAYASSRSLDTVTLDIVRDVPGRDVVLSVRTDRDSYLRARADADGTGRLVDRLEARMVTLARGRLGIVGSYRKLEDESLCPPERYANPETDERPLVQERGTLSGIERIEDLAVNEGAERAKVAEQVASTLAIAGRDAALAQLKDIHDRTEDLTLRSTCTKAELAISQGALGEDAARSLSDVFSDAWGLRALRVQASALAEKDPKAAREVLDQIVLLSQADGTFQDTDSVRYRYFDGYASRILFSAFDTEGGAVRALPDEIFAAHHGLAQLLHDSFDEQDIALEHGKRCVEIAPTVAAGYLSLARTYFLSGDRTSQIDVLTRMLRIAWNPSDVGLGLYWLAYALWRDGDPELGASCYLQAIKADPTLQDIAARELDELLKENPRLAYPGLEGSADALREAGIPVDDARKNAETLIIAARTAADSGNLVLATSLLTSGLRTVRDDALYPLLDSLQQTAR